MGVGVGIGQTQLSLLRAFKRSVLGYGGFFLAKVIHRILVYIAVLLCENISIIVKLSLSLYSLSLREKADTTITFNPPRTNEKF